MSISEKEIQVLAATFAKHSGLKLSTIATYSVNDGKFFTRLEARGSCTVRTARAVCTWLSDNWPADLAWPADIQRPSPNKKDAA